MKAFYVEYRIHSAAQVRGVEVHANNKADAYDLAVYEVIPAKEGTIPFSAWVASVTYNNGNCHRFNTCEGLPY